MLRLIIFLCVLIFSVWMGLEIIYHPGYVLVFYEPWMMQMPLWFALLAFVLFFLLFYLLIDSIDRLQWLSFKLKNWLRFRREHQSYSKTQRGLMALIEWRFRKAEKLLLAGVNQSIDPLINYLGLAKAAHREGAYERRDSYIKKAYDIAPAAEIAIGLSQAELALDQDQLEQALATLTHLRQLSPRHPRVLSLLEKVYIRLGDWKNLQALIPAMRKADLINSEQAEQFEKNTYCEMLRDATSLTDIEQIWESMPRDLRKNVDVVYAYVKQLRRPAYALQVDAKKIEELIRRALKEHWHAQLVNIYGTLPFDNLNRQLIIASAWLKKYGPHGELYLLLARLCVRIQLWGKAKDYFEKCLALSANPEASLEYGQLLESLGEIDQAQVQYREGLTHLERAG
jgi:HemY protein